MKTVLFYINQYALPVLWALIVLIVGLFVIKLLVKLARKAMDKRNVDLSLKPFILSICNIGLKILLFLSVISMVGIQATSFIAILGAVGLSIGLALSGTLQNFAGGVIILLLRPFKVGDFISAAGFLGSVKEIQMFYTILKTPDNLTVIVPNGKLSNESLTNFSLESIRRADFVFGIGYGDDVKKAKAVLSDIIEKDSRSLQEPSAPFIAVTELGDSSVNISVRVWTSAGDNWAYKCDMNETVYERFAQEGINIPFPQMDVHMAKN